MKKPSAGFANSVLFKMMARTLIVLALSVLLVEYVAYKQSSREIIQLTKERQQRLTALHAERLDRIIQNIAANLTTIHNLPSLEEYFLNRQYGLFPEADQQLIKVGDFMKRIRDHENGYAKMLMEDHTGKIVLMLDQNGPEVSPTMKTIDPKPLTQETRTGPVMRDEGLEWLEAINGYTLVFSRALTTRDLYWGRVRIYYHLDELTTALSQEQIFESGYLAVYDRDGAAIPSPKQPATAANLSEKIFPYMSTATSSTREITDDNGRKYLFSFSPMKSKKWMVTALAAKDEMLSGLNKTKVLVIQLIIANILVEFLFIFVFARNIIINPIKRLLEGTRQVLSGNFATQVQMKTRDEFGELAQSFNRMTTWLGDYVSTMESHEREIKSTQEKLKENVAQLKTENLERQRAAKALRDQYQLLQTLIEAIPAPIFYKNTAGVYLGCNSAFADYIGKPANEIVGKSVYEVAPPELVTLFENVGRGIMEKGEKGVHEAPVKYADNTVHHTLFHKAVFPRSDGTPGGLVGVMLDITELKTAQVELKRSYEAQESINQLMTLSLESHELETLMDRFIQRVTQLPWLGLQHKGAIFLANGNSGELLLRHHWGLEPKQLEQCETLPYGKCLCGRAAVSKKTVFSETVDETEPYHHPAEDHGHYCVPILSSTGDLLGVFTLYTAPRTKRNQRVEEFLEAATRILTSIIERRQSQAQRQQLEKQLLQAQKMEAIGSLASGIAHDFNNLLQAISGYTSLLLVDPSDAACNREHLSHIERATDRATDLVKDLLTFSRIDPPVLSPVDLNREVTQTAKLLERTIPKMVRLETRMADDTGKINGNANQLEQVLMNLATNARDAMPEGGTLTIETRHVDLDAAYCGRHLEAKPGPHALLRISDTGTGMDAETRGRMFDPFFTTKSVGAGTGLGLSTVYGIVKNHGGHISCDSTPGRGTTFSVYLPALPAVKEIEPRVEKKKAQPIRGGAETILLVDDEPTIIDLARTVLERQGYRIRTAASGEEALMVYQEYTQSIDLVLLDLGMPGMGGQKCLEALLKLSPGLKIIIASGYSLQNQPTNLNNSGARGFIRKPFRLTELTQTVREVLDMPSRQENNK